MFFTATAVAVEVDTRCLSLLTRFLETALDNGVLLIEFVGDRFFFFAAVVMGRDSDFVDAAAGSSEMSLSSLSSCLEPLFESSSCWIDEAFVIGERSSVFTIWLVFSIVSRVFVDPAAEQVTVFLSRIGVLSGDVLYDAVFFSSGESNEAEGEEDFLFRSPSGIVGSVFFSSSMEEASLDASL